MHTNGILLRTAQICKVEIGIMLWACGVRFCFQLYDQCERKVYLDFCLTSIIEFKYKSHPMTDFCCEHSYPRLKFVVFDDVISFMRMLTI